jgi:hypothetical protein
LPPDRHDRQEAFRSADQASERPPLDIFEDDETPGIRFADLTALVGKLPADLLGAYTAFAPPGPQVARERIETSYPGARANVAG